MHQERCRRNPGLNTKENLIATGSPGQYFTYNKTWQTLGSAALANSGNFATAAQGLLANSALQSGVGISYISGLTASLASKESSIATGTSGQYFSYNKIWQTLDKAAVGLGNVENISITGAVSVKFNTPTGNSSQYLNGLGAPTTFPTIYSFNPVTSGITRAFNTGFQISLTKNSEVRYTCEVTGSILANVPHGGMVLLESSANNSVWFEEGRIKNHQTGSLGAGNNLYRIVGGQLSAHIPSGYYVRLRTSGLAGNPSFRYITGRETTF